MGEFYADPNIQAVKWCNANPGDARTATIRAKVANVAQGAWTGGWSTQSGVNDYVTRATNAKQIPVLVIYNIPNRDNGGYSGGGAANATEYKAWVDKMVAGVAGRPVWVIVEPDALAFAVSASATANLSLIAYAVDKFKATNAASRVYIDAGNYNWPGDINKLASYLTQSGVARADGFCLNTANFYWNSQSVTRGNALSAKIGNKHYVIDTSRKGNGPGDTWCNPDGRKLGEEPSTTLPRTQGYALVDAYLWVKRPGESDGACRGWPAAGTFSPALAYALATNP